jgi:PST family polysaccharide transporter
VLQKFFSFYGKLSIGAKEFIANTSWLFSDRILQMGLSLIVGVWVARYLGPTDYGLLNYAATFPALYGTIATLGGIGTLVVRNVARYPETLNENLGTTFVLQLVSSSIAFVVAVITSIILNPNESLTHWLVGILAAGTLFQSFSVIDAWFQSQLKSKNTVISRNAAYIIMCVARVALIQMQAPIIYFAVARLVELLISTIGLIIAFRTNQQTFTTWRFSPHLAKQLLKESVPLILTGITAYVYTNIDQIMLGTMLPNQKEEMGFYSAAVRLSSTFDFIPMILGQSFFPILSKIKGESEESYLNKLQIYFDISVFFWLLVAVPASLLSVYIVNIAYGEAYAASAGILAVYAWAQFGSNLAIARNTYMLIEGKIKLSPILTASGAVLNVGLNYFLIPNYGAMGATIATLITYFFVSVFLNFVFPDLRFVSRLILRSLNLYQAGLRLKSLINH